MPSSVEGAARRGSLAPHAPRHRGARGRLEIEPVPRGVAGGRTYGAVILACALKAGAVRLLTLDVEDFESFGERSVAIVTPGGLL